jgi:hypothetical protein
VAGDGSEGTPRVHSAVYKHNKPSTLASEIGSAPNSKLTTEMESISKIEEEFSNAEAVDQVTGSAWPKINFEGPFAKFAKRDEEAPAKRVKFANTSGSASSPGVSGVPTAYPSLSYRLAVSQQLPGSVSPASGRAPAFKPPTHTPRRRNANRPDVGGGGGSPLSLAAPTKLESFRAEVREQQNLLHQPGRAPTAQHHGYSAVGVQYHYQGDTGDMPDDSSTTVASTIFQDMDMDEILDYLLESQQHGSKHAEFLHVTSRHHVEHVLRENFYDLVALERPGNPKSELVWVPSRMRGVESAQRLLQPSQVMQLSLHGLLVKHAGETGGELIDLREFMLQRSQVEYLRTGRLFGCFKELKVFTAWRDYARSCAVRKVRAKLLKETFFSDAELVSCIRTIDDTVHGIVTGVSLFAFHGRGAICITEYIALQLQRNHEIRILLVRKINALCAAMQTQYDNFVHSRKLAVKQQDVKDHHPFREALNADNAPPELMQLRALARLEDSFKDKLKRIFTCAQFKIETAMTYLMDQFWRRLKQFALGVRKLTRSKARQEDNYWELCPNIFDATGAIQDDVLERFNTVELFTITSPADLPGLPASDQPASHQKSGDVDIGTGKVGRGEEALQGTAYVTAEKVAVRFHHVSGTTQAAEDRGTRVPQDWLDEGSHLCVDINLCLHKKPIELADFMTLTGVDSLKVVIFPGRSALHEQLHSLVGSVGAILSALPNLGKHPLIYDAKLLHPADPVDPDLDLGDLTHPASLPYFTQMVVNPIYSNTGGFDHAEDAIRYLQFAYSEATAVEPHLFKLFEIVRKLWSLAPAQLAKQTERSMVLNKVKEYIEHPDTVEDLKRSQLRDVGRMKAFRAAADYLRKVVELIDSCQDIKHRHGLVASFRPILRQVRTYRSIQSHVLYTRLPVSFNTRCSVFYDFIRRLDETIETQSAGSGAMIGLLHRLKNFEAIRDIFDGEFEICEGMYRTIESFATVPVTYLDTQIRQYFDTRLRTGGAPALSSDKLFQLFVDAKERLLMCINKAKSMVLAELNHIKNDTMARKVGLHTSIAEQLSSLVGYDLIAPDVSPAVVSEYLDNCGKTVHELRVAVDETVDAQMVLLEAHDIVGAATAVLRLPEVDRFADMDELESTYNVRCKAWTCISDTLSIKRQLLGSKLVSAKIAAWSAHFARVNETYAYLLAHISEPQLLAQIFSLLMDLKPKMEVASYLACVALRPRHWRWLSEKAFAHCQMTFRFTGRHSEFVSVIDTSGREAVGLGNIHRLDISELISRCVRCVTTLCCGGAGSLLSIFALLLIIVTYTVPRFVSSCSALNRINTFAHLRSAEEWRPSCPGSAALPARRSSSRSWRAHWTPWSTA